MHAKTAPLQAAQGCGTRHFDLAEEIDLGEIDDFVAAAAHYCF